MLTEDRSDDQPVLTAAFQSVTRDAPFAMAIGDVWSVGVRRRRRARLLVVVPVLGIAAAGTFAVAQGVPASRSEPRATYAGLSPGAPGTVDFTVERVTGPDIVVACAAQFSLEVAGTREVEGGQPCDPPSTTTLGPVSGRSDDIRVGNMTVSLYSGIAPAGTVAVTAEDEEGTPLTATLRSAPFTTAVFFAFLTPKRPLLHLNYALADGRTGIEQQYDETDN